MPKNTGLQLEEYGTLSTELITECHLIALKNIFLLCDGLDRISLSVRPKTQKWVVFGTGPSLLISGCN